MAGIGFELKKIFEKKGILNIVQGYGYAGIVCAGPMILGMVLLLGLRFLGIAAGLSEHEVELLNVMITYTLLISLIVTNTFSLVSVRYVADQLYLDKEDRVLPSFWGSVSIMLILGTIGYGIFLLFSGVSLTYQVLCLVFFAELILVWTEINYLTIIKDYKGIMLAFLVGVLASFASGALFIVMRMEVITALLFAICIGYGILSIWYYVLLAKYLPQGACSSMHFLRWYDKYPLLLLLGFSLSIGLYGHIIIMWNSSLRQDIEGVFRVATEYDVPALLAILSIIVTTVSFVTSVEVNFYPKYRNYFSLYNDGGSYVDIEQAGREMRSTLIQELTYTYTKQFFTTIVFILGGTMLLPQLGMGMNEDMLGIYRVLCIGYAFYAAGNCSMMIQLYFSDIKGATISGVAFMLTSCIATALIKYLPIKYYGIGFLIGGLVYLAVSLFLLWRYLKNIMYHVLCSQPIMQSEIRGPFTKISIYFCDKYERKYQASMIERAGEDNE